VGDLKRLYTKSFMAMDEVLFSLVNASEGLYKDRGSKFYAFAFPVRDIADIEERLAHLKKVYHDARHHCYAYRLGMRGEQVFSTDDREPANSAGPPILAAIKAAQLTNVSVVVIRYFGGTKLGIRGLIDAYRAAAADALDKGETYLIVSKVEFTIIYAYAATSDVQRIFHPYEVDTVSANYTVVCKQKVTVRAEFFDEIYKQLSQAGIRVVEIKKPV